MPKKSRNPTCGKPPLDRDSPSKVFAFRCPGKDKETFERLAVLLGYGSPSAYLQEIVRREIFSNGSALKRFAN